MLTYTVTANRNRQIHRALAFKGGAETVKWDYAPWAEDNGTVSTVTWSVEAGNAAISGESLSSNVAQALITTADEGGSLLKIAATDGTNTDIQWLDILAKNPQRPTNDYGMVP